MMRAMLLGPVGCGKTTLAQTLRGQSHVWAKTQVILADDYLIDTPGEYVEHGHFNHALLMTSYDADIAVLLEAATDDGARVPPGFATMFSCPVLGVVTKTDIADAEGIAYARERLELASVDGIVAVSSLTGAGIDALRLAMDGLCPEAPFPAPPARDRRA